MTIRSIWIGGEFQATLDIPLPVEIVDGGWLSDSYVRCLEGSLQEWKATHDGNTDDFLFEDQDFIEYLEKEHDCRRVDDREDEEDVDNVWWAGSVPGKYIQQWAERRDAWLEKVRGYKGQRKKTDLEGKSNG